MTDVEAPVTGVVDPTRFRETLGHYPTGVVVVCAIDDTGAAQGMVIGSFTSVSMDPPLVAYLPQRTSRTYERIRSGTSFCVNVLGADQESLCRHFAGKAQDKFAEVSWRPAPSGAPILDGAVAWIDCTPHAVQDGGDHDIVLGRVNDLSVQSASNPLLFFQGGYGRFSHRALVTAEQDLIAAVRTAETGREYLQGLADDIGCEVNVIARSGDELVFVASAVRPGSRGRTVLGTRFPIMAPLGELHMGGCSEEELEAWARASLGDDEAARSHQIARVRQAEQRGWSASLAGTRPEGDLWSALRRYSSTELTPAQHREVAKSIAMATPYYTPLDIVDGESYDLHSLMFVIPTGDRVDLVLRLGRLSKGVDADTLRGWVQAGQQTAKALGLVAGN